MREYFTLDEAKMLSLKLGGEYRECEPDKYAVSIPLANDKHTLEITPSSICYFDEEVDIVLAGDMTNFIDYTAQIKGAR